MTAQIFLIAPQNADGAAFGRLLALVLARHPADALLLPRGERNDVDYERFARAIVPVAHKRECAVLIEDDWAMARRIEADGVHVGGDLMVVRAALSGLKPDMIVGVGNIGDRHNAMLAGEAGADYLMFGPISGSADDDARALARWWAENFEVPCVFSDPDAAPEAAEAQGCEFLALGERFWADPVRAPDRLARIASRTGAVA